jgi:hypothetical protein
MDYDDMSPVDEGELNSDEDDNEREEEVYVHPLIAEKGVRNYFDLLKALFGRTYGEWPINSKDPGKGKKLMRR